MTRRYLQRLEAEGAPRRGDEILIRNDIQEQSVCSIYNKAMFIAVLHI